MANRLTPTGSWTGRDWFDLFGKLWREVTDSGLPLGGGERAARAIGTLGDLLDRLGQDGRLKAERVAEKIIRAYLAKQSEWLVKNRWPFHSFVEDFDALAGEAVKAARAPAQGAAPRTTGLRPLPPPLPPEEIRKIREAAAAARASKAT